MRLQGEIISWEMGREEDYEKWYGDKGRKTPEHPIMEVSRQPSMLVRRLRAMLGAEGLGWVKWRRIRSTSHGKRKVIDESWTRKEICAILRAHQRRHLPVLPGSENSNWNSMEYVCVSP